MVQEQKKEIEKLINIDKLTGICNRHKLDSELIKEAKKAKRHNTDLSIILLDIDHFKSVNDNYGHLIGDKVLQEFSDVLKNSIRNTDTLGRWGGEEFLIICPFTTLEEIKILANKIKSNIQNHNFCNKLQQSASFGLAQLKAQDDARLFLNRADNALYRAKQKGRNRIEE